MSSSTPNQQATNPYLINPYAKTTSRLVRSKYTNQESLAVTKPSESAITITQTSLLTRRGRNEPLGHNMQKLLPSKVSEISSNVIFQDVDSSNKLFSRTSVHQQSDNKDKEVKPQTIGMISNVLMGATTKYSKVSQENMTTPTKNILPQQVITPNHSETENNTHNKFARRREVHPPKVEKQQGFELDLNIAKTELKEEGWTERSADQSSRKIERRTDRYRRQIKFGQKKQTKQEGDSQKFSELGQNSRILENDTPTLTTKLTNYESQQLETPILKSKYTQPIVLAKQQQKSVVQAFGRQEVVQSKQLTKLQSVTTSILKKSILVSYAIKRLLFTQQSGAFIRFKQVNSQIKRKATKQSYLIGQSVMSIYRKKQIGLIRWSFEFLKYKFVQKYLPQLKHQLLYREPNRIQISLNLLQKIYRSHLHIVMRKLKHKYLWYKQQVHSFSILDRIIKKKSARLQHIALLAIISKTKTKFTLLSNLNRIVMNLNKYKIALAQIKLQDFGKPTIQKNTPLKKIKSSNSIKELTPKQKQPESNPIQTNPALIDKTQKLRAMVHSVRDNLSMITHKLQEAELQSKLQKQELQQKIMSLKQANQQIESELQGKKGRILAIKNQINNINSKVQPKSIEDELEIPTQDHNLQKLTSIYILNYKNKEELINTTQILEEYHLTTNDCSKPSLQWQLLADNIQLKREILAYEQNAGSVEFKARKMALGEQQIAAKLVRSYIKQQYFWQWLHLTAESAECK